MRKILYLGAAAITIVAALIVWQKVMAADDEAPIRVRGGSIEIETLDGQWQDDNDAWANQTGKLSGDELWVKVTSSTGTCRAFGKPIQVQYSQPNVRVVFTRRGPFWGKRTAVSPKNGVAFVDSKHLRAGTSGDGGYITEVQTQNVTCSLSRDSQNVEISICSSSKVTDCQ